ncbi:hypothetical protein AJ80_05183 [Polytolypa hystricis UAMH7299]|uniref:7-alpha-hydroxysteroid dehydrogenase n=1 Tax=Polytolypa hystricis (strain UAMH7299) TaxID=1447883 RepID=A0A2B7Y6I8_POLH7|nr:hypothetical protein AJ80_05183 [Polytolypa hystricis UAMH7299]
MAAKAIAIIAGVGAGTGASIARKFAQNYSVALLARNPSNYEPIVKEIETRGGKAIGISTDVTNAHSVRDAFEQIAKAFPGSSLAAAVYNVGGGFARVPFLELSEEQFTAGYESTALGGFLFSQAALPWLITAEGKTEHPPTLIFSGMSSPNSPLVLTITKPLRGEIGATASVRGSANFSSLATGKFALRALSQSLAREFGPQGIHVGHVILDGVIDIERTKHWQFDAPDAKIRPESVSYPAQARREHSPVVIFGFANCSGD